MDYNRHIKILDATIAQINANIGCNCNYKQNGNYLKQIAKEALKKIGSKKIIVSAINEIDFPIEDSLIGGLYNTREIREESKRTAYRECIKALISIIEQERERLVKEQQEEEQIANKRMNKWTLICSAIAAFCAIVTLLLTIFN